MSEIDSDVLMPEPDGRARRGPKGQEHHRQLDATALNSIKAGVETAYAAAKRLAPEYNAAIWRDKNEDQRDNYVKSLAKKYRRMIARLGPFDA